MSMACRAAFRSGCAGFSSPKPNRPSCISAWVFSEKTRNSKVGGGRGKSGSLIVLSSSVVWNGMPSPEQERMDVISEALAGIVRRQREMDERLRRIEGNLGLHAGTVEPPEPEPAGATPPPLPDIVP